MFNMCSSILCTVHVTYDGAIKIHAGQICVIRTRLTQLNLTHIFVALRYLPNTVPGMPWLPFSPLVPFNPCSLSMINHAHADFFVIFFQ